MDDTQQAVKDEGEIETPALDSPSEGQQTFSDDPESSAEKPENLTQDTEELSPEFDPKSEQGKKFAEMRHEIKKLKEQVGERESRRSAFDQLKPSPTANDIAYAQQRLDIQRFVDPNTGEFQADAYNRAVEQKLDENRAISAKTAERAAHQTFDELKAKEKYPQLDVTSPSYDGDFDEAVASRYYFQLAQGKTPSILSLAQQEARWRGQEDKKLQDKAKQHEGVKDQASVSPDTRSRVGGDASELERLRRQSREGDFDAIAERVKRITS